MSPTGLTRTAKVLGTGLVGAYLTIHVALFFLQDSLLFFPSTHVAATPEDEGLEYERFTVPSTDGAQLSGWYIPSPDARGVVLYHHGNAGNIGGRVGPASRLHAQHLDVVMFDYRGYGESTGAPSEQGILADSRAVYEWLIEEKSVPPSRIVLWGRSLGGAAAIATAAEVPCAALVVESSFTSITDMATLQYPWLVGTRWLVRHPFKSAERIVEVSVPTLVAHGEDDGLIPVAHGQRLRALAPNARALVALRGGHNGAGLTDPQHADVVDEFLSSSLPSAAPARSE